MLALPITLLLVGIGWFVLIRPQQQRIRDQRTLVQELEVGDRVITAGGIYGLLTAVADETVDIEVAPGVVLTLARAAVARRVTDLPSHTDEIEAAQDPISDLIGEPTEDNVTNQTDGSIPGGPA